MKENLIKCTVRTERGLFVECEISPETIKELKGVCLLSVKYRQKQSKNLVSVRKIQK